MTESLPLFFDRYSPHIKLAHHLWSEHLKKGDIVLDATLGNGHDTAFVAGLILPEGKVISLDVQPAALQTSKLLVGDKEGIEWVLESHATYPEKLENNSLDLAIYNLGYLPGGDKGFTTQSETTLKSLCLMLEKVKPGGMISITTYSAHEGGAEEETAVEIFLKTLERKMFGVISFSWPNRPGSPKLSVIQKR